MFMTGVLCTMCGAQVYIHPVTDLDLNTNEQKGTTEGCSKFKSLETGQVQEKLASTLEHMQVPKWDRTMCPEEYTSAVGMP